jgi:hypothetical protein
MLGLNLLLENPSDASHRASGFEVSDFRFTVYFREKAFHGGTGFFFICDPEICGRF